MLDNDGDDDSLFGSPSTSPVRGRSPALALPGAGGGDCTKNVGTIALPGSHAYIELPINTPALPLSGSSFYGPSQWPPAFQTPRSQFEFQTRPSPVPSDSASWGRGEKKKKKSSRDNSSAPRAPPPPIHLPDPNAPPPANFLRNQQALLGMAGLVGGVHPAKLSVERHTRGSTPLNPIVVEDGVGRPLGRMHHPQPAPDPSKTVPPSNEEIIASLIREKNVYPVLESILKLIKGNKTSKSHDEPAAKRRRTNSGAEDAEQESTSNLEKERGKELIAQLVSLIKNAARQAAVRSYHQQPTQPRRAQPIQRWTSKPQAPEPKILGHYRPITATYGRPGAAVSEVLADQSNTTHSGSQTSLTTNPNMTSAPHIPSPLSIPPDQQPIPPFSPAPEPIAPAETSFDNFLSSFLAVPGLNDNSAGWSNDQSLSSSSLDIDQHTMNTWMSVFGSLSSEGSLSDATSQPPSEFDMDLMTSPPSDFSFHTGLTDFLPDHSMHDATIEAIPNPNPDFVIDPFLLNMPPPNPTTSLHPHNIGTLQSESSLGPNSAETSARGSLVPQSVVPEPVEDAAVQDPLAAADALMQFSSLAPSTSTTTHASSAHAPLAAPAIRQDIPRPTYQLFPQNVPTSAEQPLPSGPRTQQASQKAVTLRPMPTADKQSILTRAKERRRQLVGEIDRAKVELWETTIEQGVLAQLVKEKL